MTPLTVRVLWFGDVVGRTGREALAKVLPSLKARFRPDITLANGENAAGGLGLDKKCAAELLSKGIDVITLGDHVWSKKDIITELAGERRDARIIRPANYPSGAPGRGWLTWTSTTGVRIGVVNLLGRTFLDLPLDCPFRVGERILGELAGDVDIVFCDFHAEATSEKVAFGHFFDGRMQLIVGTHTHIPTADARVLPKGAGYVTDLGMCGARDGVIGMDREVAIERFLKGMSKAYKVAEGAAVVQGITAEVDVTTKRCVAIERVLEEIA